MVNRDKRSAAADLIQRLLDGKLPGDTFLDEFPRDRNDRALPAVYERLWFYFDDRRTQLLSRDDPGYDRPRELLERCRDFLRTDLEYDWPSTFRAPLSLILLRLFGTRAAAKNLERREAEKLTQFGDLEEWPFHRRRNGEA